MEPLKGIRALDMGRLIAGPGSTRVLAAWGAEVIKVEWMDDPSEPGGRAGQWNVDKLSITLNLKHPKALPLAKRLVAMSDVFVENFRPRAMRGLGLDYESCKQERADLIYLSMSGWGQDGPRREWGSNGVPSAAHGGISFLAGLPDRPPSGISVTFGDENAPWLAASAILTALHYRRRTGEGMYIDMAQTQTMATMMGPFFLDKTVNGRSARRPGFPPGNEREYPPSGPHNVFPCAGSDHWCAIAVSQDDEWQGLKRAMGNPNWAANLAYDTVEGRYEHRKEIDARVGDWTQDYERFALAKMLQEQGVPASVVETSLDSVEFDDQLAHRETFKLFHNPYTGSSRFKTQTPIMSKTPYTPKRAIPVIGQDNRYVYHELLGLSDEDIAILVAEEAIRIPSELAK